MVDIRFKASKRVNKSRNRIEKYPPREHGNSPAQLSQENSVDHPSAQQFVSSKQQGDALKSV